MFIQSKHENIFKCVVCIDKPTMSKTLSKLIEWTQPGQEREVGMEKAKGKDQGGKYVCACRCVCLDAVGCAWAGM